MRIFPYFSSLNFVILLCGREFINDLFDEENKIIKGEITDEESGVVAYAVTKTISKPTSWIIIENTKKFDKLNYQITKKGTYYIWSKDASGNTSRSKAIDLNWVN